MFSNFLLLLLLYYLVQRSELFIVSIRRLTLTHPRCFCWSLRDSFIFDRCSPSRMTTSVSYFGWCLARTHIRIMTFLLFFIPHKSRSKLLSVSLFDFKMFLLVERRFSYFMLRIPLLYWIEMGCIPQVRILKILQHILTRTSQYLLTQRFLIMILRHREMWSVFLLIIVTFRKWTYLTRIPLL